MKKSIVAIAFLLLCPFYGVRAQERPFFDLSGKGWHLWQDKNAAWQTEDIYLTLEEAQKSPLPNIKRMRKISDNFCCCWLVFAAFVFLIS